MPNVPEQVSQNLFDDLGLHVGLEFDDCSLAAAETCKAVQEVFAGGRKVLTVYEVGEDADPSRPMAAQLVNLDMSLAVADTAAELVLVWPVKEQNFRERHGLLRRSVTLTQTNRTGDPMLAAKIGEDCILPLASFGNRENSQHCNYVQLGSEMTDESVIMTGLDAATSRHSVVEAIRTGVERPWTGNKDWGTIEEEFGPAVRELHVALQGLRDAERAKWQTKPLFQSTRDTLQGLLGQQLAKYEEKVVEAREAQLTRRCAEKVAGGSRTTVNSEGIVITKPKKGRFKETVIKLDFKDGAPGPHDIIQRLNVLAKDGGTYGQATRVATLMRDVHLGDGRIVSLALGKEVGDKTDQVQLLAIARGDIALPIASMFSENGIVTFENEKWNTPGTEREELVRTLLLRVRNETPLVDWQTPKSYSLRKDGSRQRGINHSGENGYNYYDRLAATYCYELGLLKQDEGAMPEGRYQKCGITREGADSTYDELDRIFDNPEIEEPFMLVKSPPLELALSRLPTLRRAQQDLFNLFDIEPLLADKLGECSTEEERLIRQIGVMAQEATEFSAVIKNLDTGKTHADVVLKAAITKQDTSYMVNIQARPQAMSSEAFKPYMEYSFETTGPLFSREDSTADQRDRRARKLFNVLKQLEPVKKQG